MTRNRHNIYIRKRKDDRFRTRHIKAASFIFEDEAGFSVAELLIALTLMAFLATSLLTIITAGGESFQKVMDKKTAESETRIAISYITVKLRQHSSREIVSIIDSDLLTDNRGVLKIAGDTSFIAGGIGSGGSGIIGDRIGGNVVVSGSNGGINAGNISVSSVGSIGGVGGSINSGVSSNSIGGISGGGGGIGSVTGNFGESYFIYFEESKSGGVGRLVEKTSITPGVGDPTGAQKIADISDFRISYADEEQTIINISISCDTPNERITREVSITLRS